MAWTELDRDLFSLIEKKLGDSPHIMNSRVVCKSWQSTIDSIEPPKQLPWLLMTLVQHGEKVIKSQEKTKLIYSIFSCEIHALKNPVPSSLYTPRLDLTASKMKLTAKYGGRLFRFDAASRETAIIDEITGSLISIIPRTKNFMHFDWLIAMPDGSILGIINPYHIRNCLPIERARFDVYKIHDQNNDPYWAKVSGIGDMMIFLNPDSCFYQSASDFEGFEGNCIYFWKDAKCHHRNCSYEIGRFDLGKNKTESRAVNDYVCHTWFVPS